MNKELYVSIDIEADGPIPGGNSMLSLGAAVFQLPEEDRPAEDPPEGTALTAAQRVAERWQRREQRWKNARTPIDMYEVNLLPLPEATPDPDTMAWWHKPEQADAWAYVNQNRRAPEIAMKQFRAWLEDVARTWNAKLVFVGYPATYDFMFAYWYVVRFTGFPAPFGFQGLDLKTLAMAKLGTTFKDAAKRQMPKAWFEGSPKHTHKALDDAIGQGVLFVNLMKDLRAAR